MSTIHSSHNDEIDVFELFQTIYRGKWLIIGFVVISLLSGFVYLQLAKPKFKVSVTYLVKLHPMSSYQKCGRYSYGCINKTSNIVLKENLDNAWYFAKNSNLNLDTKAPLSVKAYEDLFDKINQKITNRVYNEAINEILLKDELNEVLMSTEVVARNVLLAKRIIKAIDNGQKAISFSSVAIKKTWPKKLLILAISAGLGGLVGFVFVSINFAISKRKENQSKV